MSAARLVIVFGLFSRCAPNQRMPHTLVMRRLVRVHGFDLAPHSLGQHVDQRHLVMHGQTQLLLGSRLHSRRPTTSEMATTKMPIGRAKAMPVSAVRRGSAAGSASTRSSKSTHHLSDRRPGRLLPGNRAPSTSSLCRRHHRPVHHWPLRDPARPCSRCSTRWEYAAARGSCVTITIVLLNSEFSRLSRFRISGKSSRPGRRSARRPAPRPGPSQSPGDRHPLLLTAGKLIGPVIRPIGQPHNLQRRLHTRRRSRRPSSWKSSSGSSTFWAAVSTGTR